MRGPTLPKNKAFAEVRIMEHVVLALEALHDDAARARVLHSACSHFRIDLPTPSEASAESSTGNTAHPTAAAAQAGVEIASSAAVQADEAEVPENFRLWLNASRI
jgi:hypothetical protein